MFQWGAAVGHIHDIMTTGNVAPGNAGIMLYSDIFLPVIGFALLWLKRTGRCAKRMTSPSLKFPGLTIGVSRPAFCG